jgi:amidophosphoribosyltransferase
VHFRIASPADHAPDYYGIDTPPMREKLLAATIRSSSMRRTISAATVLQFLSSTASYRAMGETGRDRSARNSPTMSFTGDYPNFMLRCQGGRAKARVQQLVQLLADSRWP